VQLLTPPLNFSLSQNFLPKVQNLGWKFPILGEFRGKIEILSLCNLFCQKFAAVCRKITTDAPHPPQILLTFDVAGNGVVLCYVGGRGEHYVPLIRSRHMALLKCVLMD